MTSVFAVIPVFSAQPPIDKSTYCVGTIGQPANLDPARAYDTASGEIIQNVYEPLVWYGDKHPITFTPSVGYNLTTSDISDLSVFVPLIATQVPNDTNGGIIRNYTGTGDELWTFTINTNAQFPSWTAANGTAMPAHNVTVDDVVYSFQRQMIYDSPYAPTWMWYGTAFNPNWYTWDDAFGYASYANGTFESTANETTAGNLIQSWVYGNLSQPGKVFFHFLYPYADVAMYQIFAQTWACILEKAWVIEHGGWNGTFYNGWSNDYRRKPSNDYSELDLYKDPAVYGAYGSKYPGVTGSNHVPDMLGTGPYLFTSWDKTTDTWRIDYNPNYWRGWGNAGDKAGNYIHTVIETGANAWPTRKMLFLDGEYDIAVIPRANMYDLLQTGSNYNPIAGINLAYNLPELITDEFFFCTNVSTSTPYPTWIGGPGGHIETDPTFFADQNLRTAFAWAFNYSEYIADVDFNEALLHATWWVSGLTPVNANDSFLAPRQLNYTQMQYYLDKAALVDGHNISQVGFDVTIPYNAGNVQRQVAAQAMADAWNSMPGSGGKYKVDVVSVTWAHFLSLCLYSKQAAGYVVGWLADFADAVDFAGVYMASTGAFASCQGPPYPADQSIIDAEVTQAATETNVTARVNEYHDLEQRYWNDCISLPLDQPVGRHWARDWVQEWYYNPLLPGLYAYDLYKSAPTTYQPVDVAVTAITPITAYPMVYISMGQMKQLYGGGALATMTFQIHVKRNDANTNVTLLTVAVGLERFNLTALSAAVPVVNPSTPAYPASTIVLLAPGGEWTGIFTWYEDGVVSTCQANATWEIAAYVAVVAPTTAEDNNITNNFVDSGFNSTALTSWNATTGTYSRMPGDINGDGIVNILDSIAFMNCFGKSSGQPGYNQAADLNGDGIVDISDAILFAYHLGQKIVSDP